MSNEIMTSKNNENTSNNISPELDQILSKYPQMKDTDKQAFESFIDQIKQKSPIGQVINNEFMNMPFIKKKSQAKSKIEINCYIQMGPISPYTVFLKHMHKILMEANKKLTFSQRAVLIANVWAMMSEKDKEPFKYAANKASSIDK